MCFCTLFFRVHGCKLAMSYLCRLLYSIGVTSLSHIFRPPQSIPYCHCVFILCIYSFSVYYLSLSLEVVISQLMTFIVMCLTTYSLIMLLFKPYLSI